MNIIALELILYVFLCVLGLLFFGLAESVNWLVIRLFYFSCKGLALDLEDGNFIKLADNGTVLR